MKKLLLVVWVISFVVLMSPTSAATVPTTRSQQGFSNEYSKPEESLAGLAIGASPQNLSHDISLHLVFVGYDQDVVDTAVVGANIGKYYELQYWDAYLKYNFKIDYKFTGQSYLENLRSFILDHSVTGTGITSAINETALQCQRDTGTRMSIFLPQSGRAIDAHAVEQWFADHPYDCADSEAGYTFYIMNFTEFDSADHSLEHWYNLSRYDIEAKSVNDFWRLEWDNPLNPDVKFPYPAFTSRYRLLFIDPSAFQWYLTWARIWWSFGSYLVGPKYAYYYQDLDSFLALNDVHTADGRNALAQYLAGWIDDFVYNMVSPVAWPAPGKTLSLQVLVVNNVSQYGYPNEKMQWILNSTIIREAVEQLAPYMEVAVSTEFVNLSSYPEIDEMFDAYFLEEKNEWRYYDGYSLFYALQALRDQYFDMKAAEITVNAYVFLLKNATLESSIGGMEFTGLGGMGQVLIAKSVDRYFREDGVTPKSSLGMDVIHELGHNIAFGHTFSFLRYAGDFAEDVMGYYSYFYQFCKMRTDMFRRTVVDMKILELKKALRLDTALQWPWPRKSLFLKHYLLEAIKSNICLTMQRYDDMRYLSSYYSIVKAENLEAYLREIASGARVPGDIDDDGKCHIDDLFLLRKAYGSTPSSPNWDPRADLNKDGFVDSADCRIFKCFFGLKTKVKAGFFNWKTGTRSSTLDVGIFIPPEYDIPYSETNVTYGLQNWGRTPRYCLIRISSMTLSHLIKSINVTIYDRTATLGEISWTSGEALPTDWMKLTFDPSTRYSIKIDILGTAAAIYEMTVITLECKQLPQCVHP